MTKKIECPTCQGEGTIYDRRVDNRDEEEKVIKDIEKDKDKADYKLEVEFMTNEEEEEKRAFIMTADKVLSQLKNGSRYLYDCKLPYDDSTKDLIKQLRKSGHKIRVRGSGARAKYALEVSGGRNPRMFDSSLPLKYASHVRLYITK